MTKSMKKKLASHQRVKSSHSKSNSLHKGIAGIGDNAGGNSRLRSSIYGPEKFTVVNKPAVISGSSSVSDFGVMEACKPNSSVK